VEEAPREPGAPAAEDEDYEVLRISITWGGLSIAAFALVMGLQIFGVNSLQLSYLEVIAATFALSFAGLALGLVGMKIGRGRRSARLGVFLNGVVLFCIFVLVPLTWRVLRRLG